MESSQMVAHIQSYPEVTLLGSGCGFGAARVFVVSARSSGIQVDDRRARQLAIAGVSDLTLRSHPGEGEARYVASSHLFAESTRPEVLLAAGLLGWISLLIARACSHLSGHESEKPTQ